MLIELTTRSKTSPLEVLDLQVATCPVAGHSRLSLRFLCQYNRDTGHLHMPTLSWFDASQLQQFTQKLSIVRFSGTYHTDLPDAGLRLTGSVRRLPDHWTTGRVIRVEPLPTLAAQFSPFTIHASYPDVKVYAQKLYNRLWEVFTRG